MLNLKMQSGVSETTRSKKVMNLQEQQNVCVVCDVLGTRTQSEWKQHTPVCYTPPRSPSTCIRRTGWRRCLLLRAHWPQAPFPPFPERHLLVSWPLLDRSFQPALHGNARVWRLRWETHTSASCLFPLQSTVTNSTKHDCSSHRCNLHLVNRD